VNWKRKKAARTPLNSASRELGHTSSHTDQ
jgi:hypothetical protein